VYEEAQGFRPGPRALAMTTCMAVDGAGTVEAVRHFHAS